MGGDRGVGGLVAIGGELFIGYQLFGLVEVIVGEVVGGDQLLGEISWGIEAVAKIDETLADGIECAGNGVT